MKKIGTILLFLLVVTAFAGCGKKAEETPAPVTVAPDEITALTYVSNDVTLRLAKQDDAWVWVDEPEFPLDSTYVTAMLNALDDPDFFSPVETTQEPAAYGLDRETHYLTTVTGAESQTIYFGTQGPGHTLYARSDRAEGIYLVPEEKLEVLDVPIYDMALLPELPALNAQNLVSLTLSWGGEARQHYTYDNGKWHLGGDSANVILPGVDDDLFLWQLAQCIDYHPSEGVSAVCGIDTGLTVLVRYKTDGDTTEDFTLKIGDTALDGSGRYVIAGESDAIYRMADTYLDALLAVPKPE